MSFGAPALLSLLWLVPPLGLWIFIAERRRRRRSKAWHGKGASALPEELTRQRLSAGRRHALWLLGFASIIIALAMPRWGFVWRDMEISGVDIMVVLDVSASMHAADIKPSRLERAKREVKDLLRGLRGDRVGLIVFAGSAAVECPLTLDYRTFNLYLDDPNLGRMTGGGSALGKALNLAVTSLKASSPDESRGRAIVLLSDGEEHQPEAETAMAAASKAGIRIYTLGMGETEGAPIAEVGGGFKRDRDGNVVVTRLKEELLQELASKTGGQYARSVPGDSDLERIFRSLNADTADGTIRSGRQQVPVERNSWFVAFALVCFGVEWWGRSRKSPDQ